MIPLRVFVKNFLCHAEQEFQFDGHPVWLLHGPNGVGKSAVFDAMVYALYGESRRSDARKNAVVDVIRHGESSMRVEFDLEIAGQRFQVWRTRSRSGQPKQGVNRWEDGHWSPVRDVNNSRELEEWVKKSLGLTYETFVSAVLLRQGAAEKLIDAERETRREVFRSFIDLDPYMRLHECVTAARTDLGADVRQYRARLSGMPLVSDGEIASATANEQTAEQELQKARTKEIALRECLAQARNWEQFSATKRRVESELNAAAGRIGRAAELEKQVARLKELRLLVPALTRVGELQIELTGFEDALRLRSGKQEATIARNEKLSSSVAQTRAQLQILRGQVADFERQIVTKEAEQQRLSTEIERAERASALHERLGELKNKQVEPNLDERVAASELEVAEAQSLKDAIPFLERLVKHRNDYHGAVGDNGTATESVKAASAEVERLRQARAVAWKELSSAATRKGQTEQAAAVAQHEHTKTVERRDRFATTAKGQVCSECLQPIDGEHVAKERAKLEQSVQSASAVLEERRREVTSTSEEHTTAQDRHRQLEADCRAAEQEHDDAIRARDNAQGRAEIAREAFEETVGSLDESYSRRVAAVAEIGFPTADDVLTMRGTATELADRISRRDELVQMQREREQTRRDIATLESSVAAVGAPVDVTCARNQLAIVEADLGKLRGQRDESEKARIEAEDSEGQMMTQQQELSAESTQLAGEVAAAKADVATTRKQLDTAISLVPELHRPKALTVSGEELGVLSQELAGLEGERVEAEFDAMANDRALQSNRERQLSEVEEQIGRVPQNARRSAATVEHEVTDAEAANRNREGLRDRARNELRSLEDQREQRRKTEQSLAESEGKHALHDRLAGLLGPEGIQLDLVRGAERRIITQANEILTRLSGGELRFEPPDAESSRAFEISVRVREFPEPIAVGNLSGGQRFRVAVSLALAVCQGGGDAARPLESVIIDEGFGALDREGRMAMIAELRDGESVARLFKRVIVVSHQDDFAGAFPVGYRLRLEKGATTAEAFGVC